MANKTAEMQYRRLEAEGPGRIQQRVDRYFDSWGSRLGYRVLLGGKRHFGFYPDPHQSSRPIAPAVDAMTEHLLDRLGLTSGATVLDAGCGYGFVACAAATRGWRVTAVDINQRHVSRTQRRAANLGCSERVDGIQLDFHQLALHLPEQAFDGAYTMETLVHAHHPQRVLGDLFQVLKPGGVLVLNEYEHVPTEELDAVVKDKFVQIHRQAPTPGLVEFEVGKMQAMLEAAGFRNVVVTDLTDHVKPMIRLFHHLAVVPYAILRAVRLHGFFPNITTGVELHRHLQYFRYVQVFARKPTEPGDAPDLSNE